MKKKDVIELASRRGICVYDEYEGRKVFYKVRIPVFANNKEIPVTYEDKMVQNVKEVRQLIEEIWEDDEYRLRAANWLRKH